MDGSQRNIPESVPNMDGSGESKTGGVLKNSRDSPKSLLSRKIENKEQGEQGPEEANGDSLYETAEEDQGADDALEGDGDVEEYIDAVPSMSAGKKREKKKRRKRESEGSGSANVKVGELSRAPLASTRVPESTEASSGEPSGSFSDTGAADGRSQPSSEPPCEFSATKATVSRPRLSSAQPPSKLLATEATGGRSQLLAADPPSEFFATGNTSGRPRPSSARSLGKLKTSSPRDSKDFVAVPKTLAPSEMLSPSPLPSSRDGKPSILGVSYSSHTPREFWGAREHSRSSSLQPPSGTGAKAVTSPFQKHIEASDKEAHEEGGAQEDLETKSDCSSSSRLNPEASEFIPKGVPKADEEGWQVVESKPKRKPVPGPQRGHHTQQRGVTARSGRLGGQKEGAAPQGRQPMAVNRTPDAVTRSIRAFERTRQAPTVHPPQNIDIENDFPSLPSPSISQTPKKVVKPKSPELNLSELKGSLPAQGIKLQPKVIHQNLVPKEHSQELQVLSSKLEDIQEESVVEPTEITTTDLDTKPSSRGKGKSREPAVVDSAAVQPEQPSRSEIGGLAEQISMEDLKEGSEGSDPKPEGKENKKTKKSCGSPPKEAEIIELGESDPATPTGPMPTANPNLTAPSVPAAPSGPGYYVVLSPSTGIASMLAHRPMRGHVVTGEVGPTWVPAPSVPFYAPPLEYMNPGPAASTFSPNPTGALIGGPEISRLIGLETARGSSADVTGVFASTLIARDMVNADLPTDQSNVGFILRDSTQPLPSAVPGKPLHFVYRLDSTGWPCAKDGCENGTNDWDDTSEICLICGPYSPTRYCSTEHMLEDAGMNHHLICPVQPFQAPAAELPRRFEKATPATMSRFGNAYPEHSRQRTFNATSEAGGYALFSDYIDWKVGQGVNADLNALRADGVRGNVWITVTFDHDAELQDRFNRILHIILFDERNHPRLILYLGRMIRQNLRERGLWDSDTLFTLQYQFMYEFKSGLLSTHMQNSIRDNCFAEWTGQPITSCPEFVCRAELFDVVLGDMTYGKGLRGFCEAMEARFWILRANRSTHPTVKKMEERVMGYGFPGVLQAQKGKLRARGEGWDGYGNTKDERRE